MICPLLPYSPVDLPVTYRDTDSPTGALISDLQRRLVELGAKDTDGSSPDVTGSYDAKTARILAHWIASDQTRWPSARTLEVAWGHPVTDCQVWRSLGFPCEAVEVVPGVTPLAEAITHSFGSPRVACHEVSPAPTPQAPSWLWILSLAAVSFGVPTFTHIRSRTP